MRVRWVMIVLLAGVVVLAALVLTRRQTLNAEDEDTLMVTEADIAFLRSLPVIWSPAESGAPALYEIDKKTSASVDVYRHAMRAAEVLIQLGELAPGRYEYENPLSEDPSEFQPFVENPHAEVHGKRVSIQVTEAHLKLLGAANTKVIDDGGFEIGVEINPKRPYGDMTYFELDMGAILGIEPEGPPSEDQPTERDFSTTQLEKFAALHEQTQPVLQVFLQHATLAPGRFVRRPSGYGRWERSDL